MSNGNLSYGISGMKIQKVTVTVSVYNKSKEKQRQSRIKFKSKLGEHILNIFQKATP